MRNKIFKKYAKSVPGLKKAVSKIRKELSSSLENASKAIINKSSLVTRDPFKGLVLDEYEQEIEDSIVAGDYVRDGNFADKKAMLESAARNYLTKAKAKQISLRVKVDDLVAIKAKAKKNNIPYQTLIGSLIRSYAQGRTGLVL